MERDLSWLCNLWYGFHKFDALGWMPGESVTQWVNHSRRFRSSIIEKDGEILGYVKYRVDKPMKIHELLAEKEYAQEVLHYIWESHFPKDREKKFLFAMSEEKLTETYPLAETMEIREKIVSNKAFMMKILDEEDWDLKDCFSAICIFFPREKCPYSSMPPKRGAYRGIFL